ncbi:MAG: hypothetical protein KGJ96_04940 [Xanthomonadaceae bacterium]|nr:hypothetical protein [Xanthomonadaceae bacterium]
MNHDLDDTIAAFDDAAREREWQAQELAMRRERLRLDAAADAPRVRRYRRIARALREPLDAALPADFAQQVAARAAAAAPAADIGFERALTLALGGLLALAAVVVTTLYGGTWLSPLVGALSALQPLAGRWPVAFAACMAVSWLLGAWPRHARLSPPA